MREVQVIDINGNNVALDKPAKQSSSPWDDKTADKAVDGIITEGQDDSNRQITGFDQGM